MSNEPSVSRGLSASFGLIGLGGLYTEYLLWEKAVSGRGHLRMAFDQGQRSELLVKVKTDCLTVTSKGQKGRKGC